MARKLRMLFKGAIYHVTTRGIERRRLFDDDTDEGAVSQQIQSLRQRSAWRSRNQTIAPS